MDPDEIMAKLDEASEALLNLEPEPYAAEAAIKAALYAIDAARVRLLE